MLKILSYYSKIYALPFYIKLTVKGLACIKVSNEFKIF